MRLASSFVRATVTGTLPKLLPPFGRPLLGLLILPPLVASFFLYYAGLNWYSSTTTPLLPRKTSLIVFRDTITRFGRWSELLTERGKGKVGGSVPDAVNALY